MNFKEILGIEETSKDGFDFSKYERLVSGLTLSETLEATQPTVDFLKKEHFKDDLLANIYKFCLDEYIKNGRVSRLSIVKGFLCKIENADDFLEWLMFDLKFITKDRVKILAYELDEYLKYNQAKDILQTTLNNMQAYIPFSDLSKEVDNMSVALSQLTYHQVDKKIYSYDEDIQKFENDFYSDEVKAVKTGLKDLDEALNGFGQGELIICAGRPGMGKTALMIDLIANIAEQGHNCLCFNIEMTNNQNSSRYISREMRKSCNKRVSYKELQKSMASPNKDADIYKKAIEIAKNNTKNIVNNYNQTITINEIIQYAQRHAQHLQRNGKRLDFIAIDYLQIIAMENRRDAHLEIGDITGKLKQLAKQLSVPVLLLSQLNRSIENENKKIEDRKPQLNHLRQSGKIEEDADKVIFPFRPSYYERNLDKNDREWSIYYMEIIIAKNRSGENETVKVYADMAVNYFDDMSQNETGKTGFIRTTKWGG